MLDLLGFLSCHFNDQKPGKATGFEVVGCKSVAPGNPLRHRGGHNPLNVSEFNQLPKVLTMKKIYLAQFKSTFRKWLSPAVQEKNSNSKFSACGVVAF